MLCAVVVNQGIAQDVAVVSVVQGVAGEPGDMGARLCLDAASLSRGRRVGLGGTALLPYRPAAVNPRRAGMNSAGQLFKRPKAVGCCVDKRYLDCNYKHQRSLRQKQRCEVSDLTEPPAKFQRGVAPHQFPFSLKSG